MDLAWLARSLVALCGLAADVFRRERRLLQISSPAYVLGANFSSDFAISKDESFARFVAKQLVWGPSGAASFHK